jgi:mRNA interferase RelE/StbE
VSSSRIELRPGPRAVLLDLAKPARRQLQRAIDSLAGAPRPEGAVELAGLPGALRLNVGEHRVVYTTGDGVVTVLVIATDPRTSSGLPQPE